ncbi:MAG: alanine racemase [Lachnospiraceae bacterium]|nr:alanine racemase [Lachnospiraceae bacterium]
MTASTDRTLSRTYVSVDLNAIRHNVRHFREMNPGAGIVAVVKADAYGHGAVKVAEAVQDLVSGFAVAIPEEAMELHDAGIRKPVLLLGACDAAWYETLIRAEVRIPLFTRKQAEDLREAAAHVGKPALCHVKADTGMGRIGLAPDGDSVAFLKEVSSWDGLCLEGIFTHLATADEPDDGAALLQKARFLDFVKALEDAGIVFRVRHFANSAAGMRAEFHGSDLVRLGISLYGLEPSFDLEWTGLKPALSFYSTVRYVKTVPAGTPISYGGTFVTGRETRVATVPVGYADGFPRPLSNRGDVLIRGQRCRILGRVCMDQFMADVTDLPDVEEGDRVTLIGKDGEEEITVSEFSRRSGRFHYEAVCLISPRVPRVYTE